MEKACRAYVENTESRLVQDRRARWPQFSLGDVPDQHIINVLFHQGGQHKNLYDFGLLAWALEEAGFSHCERVHEKDFLERFPEFPSRNDDYHALYVKATLGDREAA